jgi:alkylated DNA repair dioxygenase AlkB
MTTQLDFFTGPTQLESGLVYLADFFDRTKSAELFDAFLKLNWQPNPYRFTGQRPKYVWMGIPTNSTRLMNKIIVTGWTPEALFVKQLVEDATEHLFDSLQFNLYRDERDALYWHFDGETEGLWTSPIASVSLGAERRFKCRSLRDGRSCTQVLAPGSLLVMPPGFQRDYRHSVLRQQRACERRINLTFTLKIP